MSGVSGKVFGWGRRPRVAPGDTGRVATLTLVLGLAGVVLAGGCASVGRPFSPLHVPQIERGRTTKSDLRVMFGTPYRRGIDNGDSTWTYVQYKFRLFGTRLESRDLYVVFDGDRVKSYTYNSDMD